MTSTRTSTQASRPIPADLVVGSASTTGTMIAVAATSTPGTLLHTVPESGHQFQRLKVWASNTDSVNRTLTLQFGETATKGNVVISLGARRGPVLVIPDWKLSPGLSVRAFADSANVINCFISTGQLSKEP